MKPGVKTFQSLRSFILINSSQRLLKDIYNLTRLSSIIILKSVDLMYFLGVIPLEKIENACRAIGIEPLKEHSLRKSCRFNQLMKHSFKILFKVGLSIIFINAMVGKKKEDYRLSEID